MNREQREAVIQHVVASVDHTVKVHQGDYTDLCTIMLVGAAHVMANQLKAQGAGREAALESVMNMFDKLFPPDAPASDPKVRKLRT